MTERELTQKHRRLCRHGKRITAPYIRLEKDCLIWPWWKDKKESRAVVWVNGLGDNAARHLWRLFKGPIPEGMCVCHHCDNPSCVELTHFFLGTQADNVADKKRKGRQRGAVGEANSGAKLTWVEVDEIREIYTGSGVTRRELALTYGVTQANICHIVNHKTWIPGKEG